ncbi:hypothetical protein ABIA31_007785 [Catenulispora sp. MAP5-51]
MSGAGTAVRPPVPPGVATALLEWCNPSRTLREFV